MILNIIMFKNVKIGAFTNPNYTDVEPEKAAKGLERAIIANFEDSKLIKSYESLDMYYVGTFDDETGVIEQVQPVMLFSPRELILKLVAENLKKQSVEVEKVQEVVS